MGISLQVAKQAIAAAQITIDNQRIDLRSFQFGLRPLRLRFYVAIDVKTTEDALQYADFLPIPRNHHR